MYIKRDMSTVVKRLATVFPVVAILGLRQSGKTTLAKAIFDKYQYVNLENPRTREFATEDPNRFFREYEDSPGLIIDEFQNVPELLSYIQIIADEKDRPGYFVLISSHNFLMNKAITQSLAGRVGIVTLLPFCVNELSKSDRLPTLESTILKGGYPRLYVKRIKPEEFFPSYIQTYVERDVRQLLNIGSMSTFQKFMKLCAGRAGELLNIADIATNCGISHSSAERWLSILEASYIIFRLQPHFKNFNKRITKRPKLYFYDTGLVCSLLSINSTKELRLSAFRGHLFENFIIADFYKQYYNLGLPVPLHFWRDQSGRTEIDCLIDRGGTITPIEIKSGETIVKNFFKALASWSEIAGTDPADGYVVYAGDRSQRRSAGRVITWKVASTFVNKQEKE